MSRVSLLVFLTAFLSACAPELDLFAASADIGGPSWSPDGQRIAFHIDPGTGPGHIYVVEADGDGLRQLTNTGHDDRSPAWSPDGRRIAFARSPDDVENYRLFVMDMDGSNPRPLYRGDGTRDLDHPSWSPDGRRIAFVRGSVDPVLGASGALLVVSDDGRRVRRLGVADGGHPSWSPDGSWIAFDRGGDLFGVYVVRVQGSSRPRLVARRAYEASWSPDGSKLAVSHGIDGIFVVPTTGGRQRRIVDVRNEVGLGDLSWSPDGTRIAFATTEALYVAVIATGRVGRLADTGDA